MTDRIVCTLALLAIAGLAVLIGVSQPRSTSSVLEGGAPKFTSARHWQASPPHIRHCPPGELPDAGVPSGCIAT